LRARHDLADDTPMGAVQIAGCSAAGKSTVAAELAPMAAKT